MELGDILDVVDTGWKWATDPIGSVTKQQYHNHTLDLMRQRDGDAQHASRCVSEAVTGGKPMDAECGKALGRAAAVSAINNGAEMLGGTGVGTAVTGAISFYKQESAFLDTVREQSERGAPGYRYEETKLPDGGVVRVHSDAWSGRTTTTVDISGVREDPNGERMTDTRYLQDHYWTDVKKLEQGAMLKAEGSLARAGIEPEGRRKEPSPEAAAAAAEASTLRRGPDLRMSIPEDAQALALPVTRSAGDGAYARAVAQVEDPARVNELLRGTMAMRDALKATPDAPDEVKRAYDSLELGRRALDRRCAELAGLDPAKDPNQKPLMSREGKAMETALAPPGPERAAHTAVAAPAKAAASARRAKVAER